MPFKTFNGSIIPYFQRHKTTIIFRVNKLDILFGDHSKKNSFTIRQKEQKTSKDKKIA